MATRSPRRFVRFAPSKADKHRQVDVTMYTRCGLTNLPAIAGMPPRVRHGNDGRFFYADEIQAETLETLQDPNR
jgi:hypothetical protein